MRAPRLCGALVAALAAASAQAQQTTSQSILGPEAAALGGAYGAIAEDASSVIYNPAGAAFAPHTWSTASQQGYGETLFSYGAVTRDLKFSFTDTPTFVGFSTRDPSYTGSEAWAFAGGIFEDGAVDAGFDYDIKGSLPGTLFSNSSFRSRLRERNHGSNQHLVFAAARRSSDRLAFGASLELARSRMTTQTTQNAESTFAFRDTPDEVLVSHTYSESDTEAEGRLVGFGAGVLLLLDEGWRLGVSAQGGRYVWQRQSERNSTASATLTLDGKPAEIDDGNGGKVPIGVYFDSRETHALRSFETPPPTLRLAVANLSADGGRFAADLIVHGYARDGDTSLHPTADLAVGGALPSRTLSPSWQLALGASTSFDPHRAQTLHGFAASTDYLDGYLLSSGLTFVRSDFRVTGLAGVGLGRGLSRGTVDDGSEHSVAIAARRWQVGIAFVNWR